MTKLLKAANPVTHRSTYNFAYRELLKPGASSHPEWMTLFIGHDLANQRFEPILELLDSPQWKSQPKWKDWMAKVISDVSYSGEMRSEASQTLRTIFFRPDAAQHPEWMDFIIKRYTDTVTDSRLIDFLIDLSHSPWRDRPEWNGWVKKAFANPLSWPGEGARPLEPLLIHADAPVHTEYIDALVARDPSGSSRGSSKETEFLVRLLAQDPWRKNPRWGQWISTLLSRKDVSVDLTVMHKILPLPEAADHPEWMAILIKKLAGVRHVGWSILKNPQWRDHPVLRRWSGGVEPTHGSLSAGLTLKATCKRLLKDAFSFSKFGYARR